MVYLAREQPRPVEEGKPKRPDPVRGTRSPVPCYFRYLQHISWVLACISSMVVMSVFWMAIVSLFYLIGCVRAYLFTTPVWLRGRVSSCL